MIAALAKAITGLLWPITIPVVVAIIFANGPALANPDIYINDALIAEIEYGLFCDVVIIDTVDAPETDIGYLKLMDNGARIISHGTTAPAIQGLRFGVKSRAKDNQALGGVTFQITHPAFTHNGSTAGSWEGRILPERFIHQLYSFDYPYELVTGYWVFEAFKDETLLYSVPFNVVSPANAPAHLKNMCKGEDLTS